jgi:ElaA protein
MKYTCLPFSQLSSAALYEILKLRSEVFVVEQSCIYQDMDDKDTHPQAHHLMLHKDKKLIAYARLLPVGLSYPTPSIGRVIVRESARGTGLGREFIQQCIEHTRTLWASPHITIGAQSHLIKLYQEFGFSEISPHYVEDGINHVDMML